MFSKMLIFVFVFLGIFSMLLLSIPSGFFINQWAPIYQQDKQAAQLFQLSNVTAYAQQSTTSLAWNTNVLLDVGLQTGHYIELWWSTEYARGISAAYFEVRHTWDFFGGYAFERLVIAPVYRGQAEIPIPSPLGLTQEWLSNLEDNVLEGQAYCEWAANGYAAQTFIAPYTEAMNLSESWSYGYLNITMGYEFDYNQTNLNIFNLVGQILTFQAPQLSMGDGIHNTILNGMIAIPIYAMITILFIKLIQSIIPFIKGVDE